MGKHRRGQEGDVGFSGIMLALLGFAASITLILFHVCTDNRQRCEQYVAEALDVIIKVGYEMMMDTFNF